MVSMERRGGSILERRCGPRWESTEEEIKNESMLVRAWVFDREAREASLDTDTLDIGEWKRHPSSDETAIGSAMESAIRAVGEQPLSAGCFA